MEQYVWKTRTNVHVGHAYGVQHSHSAKSTVCSRMHSVRANVAMPHISTMTLHTNPGGSSHLAVIVSSGPPSSFPSYLLCPRDSEVIRCGPAPLLISLDVAPSHFLLSMSLPHCKHTLSTRVGSDTAAYPHRHAICRDVLQRHGSLLARQRGHRWRRTHACSCQPVQPLVLKSNSIMAASIGLSVARTELGPTLLLPFWTATVVANAGKA
jgi:hypothetical protein